MAIIDTQKKIVNGQYVEALADLQILRQENGSEPELLYMQAVCRRCLGQFEQALSTLEQLHTLAPEHGRGYQEEGHVHRDAGNAPNAIRAYGLACRFNPALLAAWRNQADLLKKSGRTVEAEQVRAQHDHLAQLPKPLLGAMDLVSQGKIVKAEEICRAILQQQPKNVDAMRLLADIGVRLGVLDDAEFLLSSALEFEPTYMPLHVDYIQVLRKRQKFALALDAAKRLIELQPDNPQAQSLLAIEHMQTGDYDDAITIFKRVLNQVPGEPNTLTSLGHAQKTIGQFERAVDSYRAALSSAPQHGEAYYSLANLKTYRFTEAEVDEMERCLTLHGLSHMDRVHLHFALGKALEDEGRFESAFNHYAQGNQLKKQQSRYSADQMHNEFEAQKRVCTPDLFARHRASGHQAPDPIFILGLPRAGSTLLEQILSSHSQVDGTLELPNVLALTHSMRRGEKLSNESRYPDNLNEITATELQAHGEAYIRDTSIHRQGAPYFIDKMPNNFRHIGLIKLMLPNARIIDARRHPMACCFSGFRQLFAEGQEFTYSLSDVGRYYSDYISLMDHWHKVLPGEVLTVHHEDVVADLETEVRRILDFCQLPFEQACVDYHQTERSVRTPSSEQVRQPIFKEGLDAWQNFSPWLNPLIKALDQSIKEEYKIADYQHVLTTL